MENPEYGPDVCGPDSKYVVLKSQDGHEFIIERQYAFMSKTLSGMLSGPGEAQPGEANTLEMREFSSRVVQDVCRYFIYFTNLNNSRDISTLSLGFGDDNRCLEHKQNECMRCVMHLIAVLEADMFLFPENWAGRHGNSGDQPNTQTTTD